MNKVLESQDIYNLLRRKMGPESSTKIISLLNYILESGHMDHEPVSNLYIQKAFESILTEEETVMAYEILVMVFQNESTAEDTATNGLLKGSPDLKGAGWVIAGNAVADAV